MLRDLTSPDVNAGFKVTQYPACNPVGSRKCGGVSWSDVGRKTTTTTPANLPPRGASCREVGMMARLPEAPCRPGMAAIGSMRSMRSMRGGFIFRGRRPLLKVHHSQCLLVSEPLSPYQRLSSWVCGGAG
jgi:hypothetical protein